MKPDITSEKIKPGVPFSAACAILLSRSSISGLFGNGCAGFPNISKGPFVNCQQIDGTDILVESKRNRVSGFIITIFRFKIHADAVALSNELH
jgi:hypothetical protein